LDAVAAAEVQVAKGTAVEARAMAAS